MQTTDALMQMGAVYVHISNIIFRFTLSGFVNGLHVNHKIHTAPYLENQKLTVI